MNDHSTGCSPLENLAAFAEGRLRGAERDRVVAHVADCADCREVLAASLDIAEELEAEDNPGGVVELRPGAGSRVSRFGWAAGRAAGVAAVGALVVWQLLARPTPPSPSQWLAEMPPATQLAPHVWGGVRMRGGGDIGELTPASTELGALLVDLEVTLAAGDAQGASEILNRIATILEDAGMMEDDPAALRRAAAENDVERMRATVAGQMPGLLRRIRERFSEFYLDLGTFAEEAHIAAAAGDREFLASGRARRLLERSLSPPADEAPLPDSTRQALQALGRAGATSAEQAEAALQVLRTLTR